MTTIDIRLPRLHPAQSAIHTHPARYKVVNCGRRFGKTQLALSDLIHPALKGQLTSYWCPTYKMLDEMWRNLLNICYPIIKRKNETTRRIDLITGGVIEMWSLLEPDTARGRKYHRIVNDECAYTPKMLRAFDEVQSAMLIDYSGDARFYSTPKGLNDFFVLYGREMQDSEWKSFTYTSYDNPHIPHSELDKLKNILPDRRYRQEYLAEFIEDGSLFKGVTEVSTLSPKAPYSGQFIAAVDLAKTEDFTAICVIDVQTREQVYRDHFNRISWEHQRSKIAQVWHDWQPEAMYVEANFNDANIEMLQRDGIPVTPFWTTAQSKPQIIEKLQVAIEKKEITLLNDDYQISELLAFQVDRNPGGGLKYGAPSGMHDDTVMALAIAWNAVQFSSALSGNWLML